MHRDGIARKGVHHENVEAVRLIVRKFAFQGEPRVALHDAGLAAAIFQISEARFGTDREANHGGIDFIETHGIIFPRISGNRSGAQAEHADVEVLSS
jgi:hypothetical protein